MVPFGTYSIFVMQVDSANKHGTLLEVVQILTDLNLIITKAYISSDGNWFMDGKICSSPVLFLNIIPFFFKSSCLPSSN